jgi:glutamate dehydrogenase
MDRAARAEETLADAFAERLERELGRDGLSPAEAAFVAQMQRDCAGDDVEGFTPTDLAQVAADFWAFAARRQDDGPQVRIVPARGHRGRDLELQAVQILQDDAPFLVDSIMGEITDAGVRVRAMFHPVVDVGRDSRGGRSASAEPHPESMVLVLVEPLTPGRAEALAQAVRATLADVWAAVGDFKAMRALMRRTMADLEATAPPSARAELPEDLAFLEWIAEDRFVFLGARVYDYPRTADGEYAREEPRFTADGCLGVLRDESRVVLRRDSEPAILSRGSRRYIGDAPLVVAKSNVRSRVHRRTYMDYVGVKRYAADGRACGEVRFIGLFTAEAYHEPVGEVPLIRRKAANVLARAEQPAGGHNDKRLRNVLDTYPRDELFQTSEDDLLRIATAVAHLYDRPRLRLFTRRDPFDRFVSVLMYLPRGDYDSTVDRKAGEMLAHAFGGRVSAAYPAFGDTPLARVHYIVGVDPGRHPEPDMDGLETAIAHALRSWDDRFADALGRSGLEPARAEHLLRRYAGAFSPGYRDLYGPVEALADIEVVERAGSAPIKVRAYRTAAETKLQFRVKLYREGEPAPLSDVLPILENMGLKGLIEEGLEVEPLNADGGRGALWVHDFLLEDARGEKLAFEAVKQPFEDAFLAVWTGLTENDAFNRLVLELGVSWREAALVRALARHRQQSGLDPSQAVQAEALRDFPEITRLILELFRTKFDPALRLGLERRKTQADALFGQVVEALQAVASLDADRVLRRLALLVRAAQRTNYYQPGEDGAPKPYIAVKAASRELEDLPDPKPFREIFVWAPHVEGVHLRFGPVARGGIRWSDRRDDFRTEILGLAKAQQVKNAVIVPVGAKGGFYPKALPRGGSPEAIRAEGVRAYTTFLSGLLDVTDNLGPKGEVIPPSGVIRHDGDDPYLVVAADKGTASFSDIANGLAEQYGFWLGDAFASGGSAGYDHKVMGITARGAWEAVKRHFRELGKDIQAEPFTVVGVGDMSGDVFGNGMLLSREIRLVAAFDHRHVFLDPAPDPGRSFAERQRLFDLPRSSWADYDPKLISKGGGVFPRSAKSVSLTPEVRAALAIEDHELTPAELIRAILRAPVELLYLGGIGTYVKGPHESDSEVGDKANDPVRITADQLRCKVVGEGANLGFTQAGRIAYARAGGRIDTDFIDNSAGVDTSDHEVNIKILAGAAERAGRLKRPDRDRLLQSMTDEVAAHVLRHNYEQTLALSLMEATAVQDLDPYARFMADLTARGRLDRKVEGLPGPAALAELAAAGKGLTRPELAVLLAYGKLELSHEVVEGPAPEDPFFQGALKDYFPRALQRFGPEMERHPLRREIIATVLSNEVVNRAGPTFPARLRQATGVDTDGLVRFFVAASAILRLDEAWAAVDALDGKIAAAGQLALYQELSVLLRRQTFWLARRSSRGPGDVEALVRTYRPAADRLRKAGAGLLAPFVQAEAERRAAALVEAGAPEDMASGLAALRPLMPVANLADLAAASGWDVAAVMRVYQAAGAVFGFDRLRAAAGSLARDGEHYERMAVRRVVEELLTGQVALAQGVIALAGKQTAGRSAEAAEAAVSAWAAGRADQARAARQTLEEIEAAPGGWSFAKLTIVGAALSALTGKAAV